MHGKALPSQGLLDTTAIRALYMDGEFEEALEHLEAARREGQLHSHQDSVFAYKHLGVMYAAKYETMEKGKHFMYQLLSIEPSVRIMDMYASDMIYMTFKNVQAEFEIRHARPQDTVKSVSKTPPPNRSNSLGSHRSTWPFWTAGAAALAAGMGVTAYFLLQEDPAEGKRYKGGL